MRASKYASALDAVATCDYLTCLKNMKYMNLKAHHLSKPVLSNIDRDGFTQVSFPYTV
jgi:hypothetical protein